MVKLWIVLVVLAAVVGARAQDDEGLYYDYSEESMNSNPYEYDSLEDDSNVKKDIEMHEKKLDDETVLNDLDGYQIEDNRSELKEENSAEADGISPEIDGSFEEIWHDDVIDVVKDKGDNIDKSDDESPFVEADQNDTNDYNKKIFDETNSILTEDKLENFNSFASQEVIDDLPEWDNIFNETKTILNYDNGTYDLGKNQGSDSDKINDEFIESSESDEDDIEMNENPFNKKEDINPVQDDANQGDVNESEKEEVKDEKTLVNGDINKDDFQEENQNVSADITSTEEDIDDDDDDDDDTVQKAAADLEDDLNQLFETMKKLSEDDSDSNDPEDIEDKSMSVEEIKNDVKEPSTKVFAKQEIDKILNPLEISNDQPNDFEEKEENISDDDDTSFEERQDDDYEVIEDDNLEKIFFDNTKDFKDDSAKEEIDLTSVEALLPELESKENQVIESTIASAPKYNSDSPQDEDSESSSAKSIDVATLTPKQYDDLMDQFKILHKEELSDTHVGLSVPPEYMELSVDHPLIITSPNYPANYPTNSVTDYIIHGEGMGIEMNITDFSINGALGDYLLVKPGGIDDSGNEGLIFSYELRSERRYRFLDVNKMFIRFLANPALLGFNRGFSLSLRMITPPPEEPEPVPEPSPLLPSVHSSLTVNLGSITPARFLQVKEEFRQILADMATMYINSRGIDPGMNTTSEITQITRQSVCTIEWPEYQHCTAVTFGVPLVYDDDQPPRLTEDELREMWTTYFGLDPFALRLWRLGITEFVAPNDQKVLMLWLLLAFAVALCFALFAFALWRYRCDNYTRMSEYNDDSSLYGKKWDQNLFPTPHQTVPTFDGIQCTDSTIDMDGVPNRGYDMYDSDEENNVVVPGDRPSAFTTRDGRLDV